MRILALGIIAMLFTITDATAAGKIELTAVRTGEINAVRGPAGRAGDVNVLRFALNDRYGRQIGIGVLSCRWTSQRLRLCLGSYTLPLGVIVVAGSAPTPLFSHFAVVGGTETYQGVRGASKITAIGEKRSVISISLL